MLAAAVFVSPGYDAVQLFNKVLLPVLLPVLLRVLLLLLRVLLRVLLLRPRKCHAGAWGTSRASVLLGCY